MLLGTIDSRLSDGELQTEEWTMTERWFRDAIIQYIKYFFKLKVGALIHAAHMQIPWCKMVA